MALSVSAVVMTCSAVERVRARALRLLAPSVRYCLCRFFLGVWMSSQYASLACVGFPACNGQWWPKMDFASAFTLWQGLGVNYEYGVLDSAARKAVHFSHRLNALALVAASVAAVLLTWRSGSPAPRRSATLFLALLGVQIVLGGG